MAETIKRDAEGKEYSKKVWKIPLTQIVMDKNSRVNYDKHSDLSELMSSMKNRDLLSPIGVHPIKGGEKYKLIFGNRRFMAAKKLDWKTIDAVFANTETEEDEMIVNAIENMQREDVPLAEQGRIFSDLLKKKLTATEIAAKVGVKVERVKNALELFYKMPEKYRDKVIDGTAGRIKKNGSIPARTAFNALAISSKFRLGAVEKNQLFDYAAKDNVSGDHLRVIAGLMKNGVKVNQAIRKASDTRIVTLSIAIDKVQAHKLEEKYNATINDILSSRLAADKALDITFIREKVKVKKKASR